MSASKVEMSLEILIIFETFTIYEAYDSRIFLYEYSYM